MTNVKIQTSKSYQEFLIEQLKDPEHAALYIEACLEEQHPEPELLRNVLRNVIEAQEQINTLSESSKLSHQKLDQILTESGCAKIYAFVEVLNALGFQISISLKETES
ncbi:helix-turn-helix domain-containing transcriptional regulator [Planktothrix agardhii]|jgi:DNA-binding phage protein|uniref:helix-turn-helix domain-containing transcriptional regulator n=1 Tax=Planktothrix agardhii TaxID=1160 RepID=UPI002B2134A9|nr:transcriptional regulator [Planktothrix agardhii]MEA5560687.1 transcriptional regulator [Planktothrix agardhii UHCC 0887]